MMNIRGALRCVGALREAHPSTARYKWAGRLDPNAPLRPERAHAIARLREVREQHDNRWLSSTFIKTLPSPLREEVTQASSAAHRYRCTLGHIDGVAGMSFFVIDGQGDTWEEAVEAVSARLVADRERWKKIEAERKAEQAKARAARCRPRKSVIRGSSSGLGKSKEGA